MNTPPIPPDLVAQAVADERLRLLSIGYYISGAVGIAMVSFLLIHFAFVLGISFLPESAFNSGRAGSSHSEGPPVLIFRILAGVLALIIFLGWLLGGLTAYAGRCIARREKRLFVLVMASLNCIWIPYGTLLGVASLLCLATPEVKKAFAPKP